MAAATPLNLCLLSNGHYHVMLTDAGSGYADFDGMDVTRWREDATRDCWGHYCYIRDADDGRVWSAGRQPFGPIADEYAADLQPHRGVLRRHDGEIETRLEVAVAPDVNAEVRRITLTNRGNRSRTLEVTSYAEVALNARRADQAHPAFTKLFLETEYLPDVAALLCRRRPRSRDQKPVWALHVSAANRPGDIQFETDRARFLGRGRSTANPYALETSEPLSGTCGPVLDPIFSLRRRLTVAPGASVAVAFTTATPVDRENALAVANRFRNLDAVNQVLDAAESNGEAQYATLGVSAGDAVLFQRLAAHVIFTSPTLRSRDSVMSNRMGQPGLWPHAISGDLPIIVIGVGGEAGLDLAQHVLRAHAYWRWCGLVTDLILLNDAGAALRPHLDALIQPSAEWIDKSGGVFLRDAAALSTEDNTLLEAAARAILRDRDGTLADQLSRTCSPSGFANIKTDPRSAWPPPATEHLLFDNGLGGFTPDGREYVIRVRGSERPPAPWSNVLANPDFGCIVTESGGGYTWAGNSQMNRLTPWSNDPVTDAPGEIVYLRDEDSREFWTPTPAPCGGDATTIVRHGHGYTRFVRNSHGLEQELLVLVPSDAPVKLLHLRIRNTGDQPRKLSTTFYAEWVVGTQRDQAALQVVCTTDPQSGAMFATNAWAGEFAGRTAFADVSRAVRSFATDRAEFLGRGGTIAAPAAMSQDWLSSRAGELGDPCAAIMTHLDIAPGATEEVVFVLGQGQSVAEARRLAVTWRDPAHARAAFEEVRALWDGVLGAVQVRTPDPAFDLLLNGWLLYQALACRIWGRSGFYQSGGAYGFRDQLQDAMAVVYGAPEEARAQILRAAARQFEEGDVQHWWHPPAGRGVRTRITDDLYFLPFVICHYVRVTGDTAIPDERVPFLHAPVLNPDQEDDFNLPAVSDEIGTLYEHCVRALEHGLKCGPHGIPLMGTGDWNDGMNQVGIHGQGESIWNGWFMLTTLQQFAHLAERRGDAGRATWCRDRAEDLRIALEEHAWDGRWYKRAYFDDGTPLGSAVNDECQIDSIAQSWAVISGAAAADRARRSMEAVEERLVNAAGQLILLFDPPFDRGVLEPGYIKGYVPGIRENGGQYTHAATWVVLATALLGRGERAVELFGLLNPINHATSPDQVARYKVEPYVVAADVYGAPPHTGRGGWTWYTGSASWLYRIGLETILGFHLRGSRLYIDPCVPINWSEYEITYRVGATTWHVTVANEGGGGGVGHIRVDGQVTPADFIDLADDGRRHEVRASIAAYVEA